MTLIETARPRRPGIGLFPGDDVGPINFCPIIACGSEAA
jgi:hypothetical protein